VDLRELVLVESSVNHGGIEILEAIDGNKADNRQVGFDTTRARYRTSFSRKKKWKDLSSRGQRPLDTP
jgi:hypothetical protein